MLSRIKYFLKYGIPLAVIAAFIFCMYACSPQQKLKRLIKKHPELVKSDTVYITRTLVVPEFKNDTLIELDTTTAYLSSLIDSLCVKLDSMQRDTLKVVIHKYIINRPVLKDTFYVPLKENGWIKIYQDGKVLRHKLFEPAYTKTLVVPMASQTVTPYRDIPWRLAWYWVVIAFVCGMAIAFFILLRIKNNNTKSPEV